MCEELCVYREYVVLFVCVRNRRIHSKVTHCSNGLFTKKTIKGFIVPLAAFVCFVLTKAYLVIFVYYCYYGLHLKIMVRAVCEVK